MVGTLVYNTCYRTGSPAVIVFRCPLLLKKGNRIVGLVFSILSGIITETVKRSKGVKLDRRVGEVSEDSFSCALPVVKLR